MLKLKSQERKQPSQRKRNKENKKMFSVNSYAKIKEVEDKGNYSVCKISISKKNKTTGNYETDFVGKVRFVGQSHLQRPLKDQRIKITSCGVSNCYVKDDKLEFLNIPTYTVFAYELQDDNGASSSEPMRLEPIDSSELPF
jgi:hypothetical protein